MVHPLSLSHFYLRNKRKIIPVIGILALAIVGVVVTDSLLASARETAYATFGSYQKLILVAPRATREQDLANPLAQSLSRLQDVQSQVQAISAPQGLDAYYAAVAAIPVRLRAQVPVMDRAEQDAAAAQDFGARLRGDLAPLDQLLRRVQRVQTEEAALTALEVQLTRNPQDLAPLVTYLQQHRTWLQSVLPAAADLGQLQQAVVGTSADALGLQQSLARLSADAAALAAAGRSVPSLPPPPAGPDLGPFRASLDALGRTLNAFQAPQADLDRLLSTSTGLRGVAFAQREAFSNLDINLLAGNAQFDLYGLNPAGMQQLLNLYGDRVVAGRLPQPNASEVAISQEIARARNVWIGGQVGNKIDELDSLPDAFTVVGILQGPTRIGVVPYQYMTQHYLFERRYEGLVVAPRAGQEGQVHAQIAALVSGKPFRIFDWPYIKGKIDSLIQNLDTINRFLILLVTIVLSLVVGLLNNLFFRQRMNEFGLLAAIGYSRLRLIGRVAWESLGVTLAAWALGLGLGVGVLAWFNETFMVPHGLLMNVFNWRLLLEHTLPIPIMVFLFGMGTVGWQLLRLDPISIIERRD
ncbi:MAG TPA: FtsX-like permease family protein [Candidatus Limnocylindrales bacterium]|nr:FtsX-like permease family protein [Candidatus Limnocylindrales bacterium]